MIKNTGLLFSNSDNVINKPLHHTNKIPGSVENRRMKRNGQREKKIVEMSVEAKRVCENVVGGRNEREKLKLLGF